MARYSKAEKEVAREILERFFPKGSTVYTVLRSVSRSGMTRIIGVVAIQDGEPYHPNYATAAILDRAVKFDRDGVVCHGAGMDMGFELAYSIGRALYDDGYALNHRWI